MSKRSDIVDALETAIKTALPGRPVFRYRTPQLGRADDAVAAAIIPDNDDPADELPELAREWPLEVWLLRKARAASAIEQDIEAVIREVESTRTLGGIVRAFTRETISVGQHEDGTDATAASIRWIFAYEVPRGCT